MEDEKIARHRRSTAASSASSTARQKVFMTQKHGLGRHPPGGRIDLEIVPFLEATAHEFPRPGLLSGSPRTAALGRPFVLFGEERIPIVLGPFFMEE